MNLLKKLPICFFIGYQLIAISHQLQAQTTVKFDFSPGKAFIENKGQLKTPAGQTGSVLYAYDEGATKIYFTAKGLIYSFTKVTVNMDFISIG